MIKDDNGYIVEAAMKIYDDTELVLINYDNYNGLFRPGFKEPHQKMRLNFNAGGLSTSITSSAMSAPTK